MARALDYAHRRLLNTVGPERVSRVELERMAYGHDFAMRPKSDLLRWRFYPDFVVLPQTTEEVSSIVRLSDETGLPITPKGGGTGGVGGAVPTRGGILIDMRKMHKILGLNAADRTVTVEAGTTWARLSQHLEPKGFMVPVVPMDAPSSTVGGAINSGSVAIGSFRHGPLRNFIVDLEVVLPDGSAVHTGPSGDAGGRFADLKGFFSGAEGTLGIVTKAVLRLLPKGDDPKAVAYAFPDAEGATGLLKDIPNSSVLPLHAVFLDRVHFLLEGAVRVETPDQVDTVLVALQGAKDEVQEQEKEVERLAVQAGGTRMAADVAADLWSRRFVMYGARRISRGLVVSSNLVPVSRIGEAAASARAIMRRLKHVGAIHAALVDSSTALLAPYILSDDVAFSSVTSLGFAKKLGDAVLAMGGHPMGLGLYGVFNLPKMHGRATEFAASTKRVFDPGRKVNGGKTVEIWTKFTWPIIDSIPPSIQGFELRVAAFLRRLKPGADKYARPYERRGA